MGYNILKSWEWSKLFFLVLALILSLPNDSYSQNNLDYPVNIGYVEGSVCGTSNNTFSLLGGSKWISQSYLYPLPASDVLIIIMDKKGNGVAYSDGTEFKVRYASGRLNYKKGKLNLVTKEIGNGAVLRMADGSLWEVTSYDQFDTGYWLPPYHVIITSDEMYMINIKEGKKIWITRAN